jgi:diphosphomevalonate decarboxylase
MMPIEPLPQQFNVIDRYWGKRDTKLILPTNSSLSVTLDQDHLRATTTSRADPKFDHDQLWLNGTVDEIKPGGRLATCIAEMKKLRAQVELKSPNEPKVGHNLDLYIARLTLPAVV